MCMSLPIFQRQLILQDQGYGANASLGVPIYSQAFAGFYLLCVLPKNGQVELTWVAGLSARKQYPCQY